MTSREVTSVQPMPTPEEWLLAWQRLWFGLPPETSKPERHESDDVRHPSVQRADFDPDMLEQLAAGCFA